MAEFTGTTNIKTNSFSSPQSVLDRLEYLDIRIKQLEEDQRSPRNYFSGELQRAGVQVRSFEELGDRNRKCRPLTSALQEVHLKGTLMERLKLLEERIQQLSRRLEMENKGGASMKVVDENDWIFNAWNPRKERVSSDRIIGKQRERISHRGYHVIREEEEEEEEPMLQAAADNRNTMKKISNQTQKSRRHSKLYKRWFSLGC